MKQIIGILILFCVVLGEGLQFHKIVAIFSSNWFQQSKRRVKECNPSRSKISFYQPLSIWDTLVESHLKDWICKVRKHIHKILLELHGAGIDKQNLTVEFHQFSNSGASAKKISRTFQIFYPKNFCKFPFGKKTLEKGWEKYFLLFQWSLLEAVGKLNWSYMTLIPIHYCLIISFVLSGVVLAIAVVLMLSPTFRVSACFIDAWICLHTFIKWMTFACRVFISWQKASVCN